MAKAKDPVCGMDVEANPGAKQSSYLGKTFHFCSDGCRKTFDQDPARHAKG